MTLDPRLLRPFVVLTEELHFGRAAQRLHVTQPALSQQVQRLEGQLGVELFARTRARVVLAELRARRPGLTLEAKQDNSGVLCADLAAGRLDVAITFEPEQVPGTVCEEISREPAVVAVAAGHPLAGRKRVALLELADYRFALVDRAGGRGY